MLYVFMVLRVQASIFANLQDAIPEINDPLLLETRIPQFLGRVSAIGERVREHFAQYYPNCAEQ